MKKAVKSLRKYCWSETENITAGKKSLDVQNLTEKSI